MWTKRKRLFRVTSIILVVFLLLCSQAAFAVPAAESAQPSSESGSTPESVQPASASPTSQPAPEEEDRYPDFDDSVMNADMTAVLLDADTGEILFERHPDNLIYPASTTKIMTGLLAIELNGGTLDGEITCGPEVNAFSSSSSLLGLMENHTVSIQDLVYGLMLVSGNDAAAALAVHFGGSLEGFVALMNNKAQELGMTNTVFGNPHGLDQRSLGLDHHSTAADMAKLAEAAYHNEVLMTVMGTQTYEITSTELNPNIRPSPELHNGNYLLETPVKEPQRARYAQFRYQPTTGMKTGLLQNVDGYYYYGCLVASASRDGRNLIATIFADTSNYGDEGPALDRWKTAIALFEYGFTGFVDVETAPYITDYETQVTLSGVASNDPYNGALTITAQQGAEVPETINLERSIAWQLQQGEITVETVPEISQTLVAPVTAGQTVGTLSYRVNGQEYFQVPLVASRTIYAEGDEAVTSQAYNVEDPTAFPWWMWLVIGGAGAGVFLLVYYLLQRRRYAGRYIGKHRTGGYSPYPRNWNDDIPLSALRTRGASRKSNDRWNTRGRYKRF